VLLKALLVHGARWGESKEAIARAIPLADKALIARMLGYGTADVTRVMECAQHRATAIGFGALTEDQAHRFTFPLPPSLSGRNDWRRLVVTLAWFTPINAAHRAYRRAQLFFYPVRTGAWR